MSCEPNQEYVIKYDTGSYVYPIYRAKKGVLEKLRIKTFNVNVSEKTFGKPIVSYTDNANRLWMEKDLCSHSEAVVFAADYLNGILENIEELED